MGKRGPRPTPAAIKLARGTYRADRDGSAEDVPGEMKKPAGLGEIASAVWDRTMPVLEARKTVSPAYVDFLTLYCKAHQDMHDAEQVIQSEGMFCVAQSGEQYPHHAVVIKHKAADTIQKIGREFGFSPASIRDVAASPEAKGKQGKKRFFRA